MKTEKLCGVTFAPFAPYGCLSNEKAKESLRTLKEETNANFVIFVPNGLQDTPQSEEICYTSKVTMDDDELKDMIDFAQSLNMKVALKPTANCKNGTWRAHISFFDEDVPCEPKWSNWFESYSRFQNHYAKISQEMGCYMHIAGCEMVMSEHREKEWRNVISDIRSSYKGIVSYNTDKYQEHNVKWWDCVDYISSSGYYPIDDWDRQLDRIETVVSKFNKPFFFAESGCMSVKGSNKVPNNWTICDEVDLKGQADWFDAMFTACKKRPWVEGFAIWSWTDKLYPKKNAASRGDYEIYGKPACEVIKKHYQALIKGDENT